jgi:AraC family transcriptional activator FtrA
LGLLDGKRATTHWEYIDEFKTAYPRLQLVPEILYVDEGQILTAAGSAAGIDLLLHIVRSDFGSEAANRVARRLVVPAHRDGGQAQFIERPVARRPNGRLAPLLDQMRSRLDRPQSNRELAREAAMSERTFLRRFREITGTTPARWLHEQRIAVAQQLLEESDAPMEEIAAVTGYGTGATMRVQFRKRVGIAPSEYRRRFARGSARPARRANADQLD